MVQLSKPRFYMLCFSFRKPACQVKTGEIYVVSSLKVMRELRGQIGTNTRVEDMQRLLVFVRGGKRKLFWREVEPVIYANKTSF